MADFVEKKIDNAPVLGRRLGVTGCPFDTLDVAEECYLSLKRCIFGKILVRGGQYQVVDGPYIERIPFAGMARSWIPAQSCGSDLHFIIYDLESLVKEGARVETWTHDRIYDFSQ